LFSHHHHLLLLRWGVSCSRKGELQQLQLAVESSSANRSANAFLPQTVSELEEQAGKVVEKAEGSVEVDSELRDETSAETYYS
jgi:hypothetical protein